MKVAYYKSLPFEDFQDVDDEMITSVVRFSLALLVCEHSLRNRKGGWYFDDGLWKLNVVGNLNFQDSSSHTKGAIVRVEPQDFSARERKYVANLTEKYGFTVDSIVRRNTRHFVAFTRKQEYFKYISKRFKLSDDNEQNFRLMSDTTWLTMKLGGYNTDAKGAELAAYVKRFSSVFNQITVHSL